jgi:hypothetical protein
MPLPCNEAQKTAMHLRQCRFLVHLQQYQLSCSVVLADSDRLHGEVDGKGINQ